MSLRPLTDAEPDIQWSELWWLRKPVKIEDFDELVCRTRATLAKIEDLVAAAGPA
jgi:hypothetical protein